MLLGAPCLLDLGYRIFLQCLEAYEVDGVGLCIWWVSSLWSVSGRSRCCVIWPFSVCFDET